MLKDILDRIKRRLEATNQTAAAASAKAGLSKDASRNIERAVEQGKEAGASTITLVKLAPILETSASWLLEGFGPEERKNPEATLRSALIAYGVDRSQLDLAVGIIGRFVQPSASAEQSEQNPSGDQSQPSNRPRVPAP